MASKRFATSTCSFTVYSSRSMQKHLENANSSKQIHFNEIKEVEDVSV